MSENRSHYVHGTDPEEQQRLSRLNDLLNEGSLREMALAGGERILDLGCGTGQLTLRMAATAGPRGSVVAVDRSLEQLEEARKRAKEVPGAAPVDFRAGDVLALELRDGEWGSFDLAHARFLLEHVPNPLSVVRSMVRAVRPGGRIVLEDEDHALLRLWPPPDGFEEVWEAYMESYRLAGNDPHIGLRLIEALKAAGAEPQRNGCIWFGCAAGDPMFSTWVANLLGVLEGARRSILGTGRVHESTFDAALRSVAEWGGRDDAAAWYFMAYAEGRKSDRG